MNRPENLPQANRRTVSEDLGQQIRDALLHLYDLTYLQTHPLSRTLSLQRQAGKTSNPGKALRQVLLDAIEALHPGQGVPSDSSASRAYQLLRLRYVEALEVAEVERRLSIGKSEYHRDHRKGMAALASLLEERFGLEQSAESERQGDEPGEASSPARLVVLPSPKVSPGNLPIPLTSFVGREREAAEVQSHLGQSRLLTLTGTGGSGKTRLALHVAAGLEADYPEGVWLVELGALADPTLVPQTVAATLDLVEEAGYPIVSRLTDYLRSRRSLLVLDNCEHLVEACAKLVDALLRVCPALTVLATSREALRTDGETIYQIPPLAAPDPERLPALEELRSFGAISLFAERAAAARPGFQVTAGNASAVARICSRLDGLPLAIELAAARVRVLAPEQIAARLDDRFGLLTGGSRTALPRQQTLAATLDWSHDLLTEPEQALLRRVAVFAGGWSLEASEAVCADEVVRADQVLDLLTKLVDRSLVLAEAQHDEVRYRLLETVREYSRGMLVESGEAEWVRRRHLDWALALAEEVEHRGRCLLVWPPRLVREHENFRAAADWSRTLADGAEAELRLAAALAPYQRSSGFDAEARDRLTRALARSVGLIPATRAAALFWMGLSETFEGHLDRAQVDYEESLALAKQAGDPALVACALRHHAWLCESLGRLPEAVAFLEEALPLARQVADGYETAMILQTLGEVLFWQGKRAVARRVLEEGIAIAEDAAEESLLYDCKALLGELVLAEGEYPQARILFGEWLEYSRRLGVRHSLAQPLSMLGDVARAEGDHAGAQTQYLNGLREARESGSKLMIGMVLGRVADLWAVQRRWHQAARLYGMLDAWYAAAGMPPHHPHPDHDRDLAATRAMLGEEAFALAWAEGQAMTLDQAVEYALQDEE